MQSPIKLFSSLKHGDPQAVAVTAVMVFFLSVCWFSWTFLSSQNTGKLPLGTGRARAGSPPDSFSLQDVLAQQRGFVTPDHSPNPFFKEPPEQRSRNPRNQRPPRNNRTQASEDNPVPTTNNPPPPRKTDPEPQTRSLTLTYKGTLTRPDRQTVALVSVEESGKQFFLKKGEKLDIFRLTEMTTDSIRLQPDEGPTLFIPRGKAKTVKVPL